MSTDAVRSPTEDPLRKLHVELTTRCNLNCAMCQRHVWDEPDADMAPATFEALLRGLADFPGPRTLQLSGYGEPLAHPRIVDFVQAAGRAGVVTEIVTNGALLSRDLGMALIAAGLTRLVLSVGCGDAAVDHSVANLRRLHRCALGTDGAWPQVAIHAVLRRSSLRTLGRLRALAMAVHADTISVSHLLPYTTEMAADALYGSRLPTAGTGPEAGPSRWRPHVVLPALEWSAEEAQAVGALLAGQPDITLGRTRVHLGQSVCPFVVEGRAAVDWRGNLAPCLPLLRAHPVVTPRRRRTVKQWHVGNVTHRGLGELWRRPTYTAFRQRVRDFAFPPCPNCGDCELVASNDEDCYGNPSPTCGDCLYARGLVRCP
ncbi:MAG: radical SAM protein [Armatimonadetes bacterium]|nr:radical SAM protein [Armatimonadota bacterium]